MWVHNKKPPMSLVIPLITEVPMGIHIPSYLVTNQLSNKFTSPETSQNNINFDKSQNTNRLRVPLSSHADIMPTLMDILQLPKIETFPFLAMLGGTSMVDKITTREKLVIVYEPGFPTHGKFIMVTLGGLKVTIQLEKECGVGVCILSHFTKAYLWNSDDAENTLVNTIEMVKLFKMYVKNVETPLGELLNAIANNNTFVP
jgi:hypothetical protein